MTYYMSSGTLTVSSPAMPNGYTSKCSGPCWSNPPCLIFDIRALWRSVLSARAPECQKIKKGGLDQYGTERFGRLILPQSEEMWDWKSKPYISLNPFVAVWLLDRDSVAEVGQWENATHHLWGQRDDDTSRNSSQLQYHASSIIDNQLCCEVLYCHVSVHSVRQRRWSIVSIFVDLFVLSQTHQSRRSHALRSVIIIIQCGPKK